MKLLATGAAGFVISHVVREFLERNPGSTAVIADIFPMDSSAQEFFAGHRDRIEVVPIDVGEADHWNALTQHGDITDIVHGATVTSIASKLDSLENAGERGTHIHHSIATNVMGTVNALNFALGLKNLSRLINVSSGSVYDLNAAKDPLPEEGYVLPDGFYAASKYSAELLVNSYANQFDLPATNVRLSGVYGPMDRETPGRDVRCVPHRIAHGARKGIPLLINSRDAVGDFIHVGDVATAINGLLSAADTRYDAYNIAYSKVVSMGQLINLAQRRFPELTVRVVADTDAEIFLDPLLNRGRYGAYDITRISEETGWHPEPIEKRINDYFDWLENHPF